MTPAQREVAELLHDLKRPAELIAVNSGIDLPTIKAWLRTGRWPKSSPRQGRLFDPSGLSPRPSTTKPADTNTGNSGLHLFARAD